jgi:hypothetical protein
MARSRMRTARSRGDLSSGRDELLLVRSTAVSRSVRKKADEQELVPTVLRFIAV